MRASPRAVGSQIKGESAVAIMIMLEITFWSFFAVVTYVYIGYPLALLIMAGRKDEPDVKHDEVLVPVSLIVSVFNEENCIASKLDNCLELEYPAELLEIIVVSDASIDRTDSIVANYTAKGVKLLRMEQRGGKTLGLNMAAEVATGEVMVFSDANAMYQPDAINALVAPFIDPSIGAVIGESGYTEPDSDAGRSESLYWRYETAIKVLESRRGSVVGGDGAIYAVRRSLYKPMSADALSDFVNPLQVVAAGYRCVYQPEALSYEETAGDFVKEYRRKVRIVNRAWRALWIQRHMLNPLRYGAFSLKLWSHKVLRWWVPFMLVALSIINVILVTKGGVYAITLIVQVIVYALAFAGFVFRDVSRQPRVVHIPYYFCLVNFASAVGLVEAMAGKSYTTWTTVRAEGA